MLKTKCEYNSNITIAKFISIVLLIIFVFSLSAPIVTYAATIEGLSYSGNSYYAINSYGVNLRDANGKQIMYISKNHCMKVLGIYSSDKTRVVVNYNGKIGSVLKSGLKNVTTKYQYTEAAAGEYIAINKSNVNFRDQNYKKIQNIPAGKEMTVLGTWKSPKYSGRAVVVYNGLVGTVLNSELIKRDTTLPEQPEETVVEGYWAWTGAGVNMRKEKEPGQAEGDFIEYIPAKSLVWFKGINEKDTSRANITFNGSDGNVLKGGLRKASSSEIIPFKECNTSNSYVVTNASELNMRKNVDGNGDGVKDLIETLTKYTVVYVLGISKEETNRLVVVWHGQIGTILNNVASINNAASVCIDRQKTTMFKNGKIVVQADCVTGTLGKYDTPTGRWKVLNKLTKQHLVTYDVYVDYWIGFTNRGHGFHDASWRYGVFGGNIYKTNGSHGCVNLSLDTVKTIYQHINVGNYVYISKT